jgi:hypothetical protein
MSLYSSSSNTKESIHCSERAHVLQRCPTCTGVIRQYPIQRKHRPDQNNINTKIGVLAILASKAMSSPLTTFHSSHMNTTVEARGIIPKVYICDRNKWVGKCHLDTNLTSYCHKWAGTQTDSDELLVGSFGSTLWEHRVPWTGSLDDWQGKKRFQISSWKCSTLQ